ncbi:hypothetical protein M9458_017991 [Cirrhinus mrigala]|uniref:Gypsy retrotransposon integrase-like protein 1 n=1 Tax=Cirrhinus mrigala TaxID=683832 RepID=A0ABD0QJV6_CIRMR
MPSLVNHHLNNTWTPNIPPNLIVRPIVWNQDQDIQHATLQEPALPECPEGKIYVPRSLLGTAHQSPGSGHPGSKRTLSLLQTNYWWPSMRRDTIRYVQSCSVCAMSNSPRMLPTGNLVSLPIPERSWSHLCVDFVTDLPSLEGNTCVLVLVDRFSKSCKFVLLKGLPTAMETAEHLFHQVFCHFGIPEETVSDRGPQFISHLLGVTVNLSSGYHPQTNGQAERKIQELGRYLRAYCHEDHHSWSRFLLWAEYAQNFLCQDTTGLTPFQCVLGYQPPLFPWTEEPSNVPAVDHWFRESERVWDSAHHHLQRAVCRNKRFADARCRIAPRYQPGDLVWLSTRDLRLWLPCRKLSPRYLGPFKILRQINDVTFQLQLPPRHRIHPTFHKPRELKRNPLLQKSWTNHPSARSTRSWTHDVGEATWNTSLTGRGTEQKSDPGSPETMCWTTRIVLPLLVVALGAAPGGG